MIVMMRESALMDFRQFYDRFYEEHLPYRTAADEMRTVHQAYKCYRLYEGLTEEKGNPERARTLEAQMEYHIGACELAELTGDKALVAKHRNAFFIVWKEWFAEITGQRGQKTWWQRMADFWRNLWKV